MVTVATIISYVFFLIKWIQWGLRLNDRQLYIFFLHTFFHKWYYVYVNCIFYERNQEYHHSNGTFFWFLIFNTCTWHRKFFTSLAPLYLWGRLELFCLIPHNACPHPYFWDYCFILRDFLFGRSFFAMRSDSFSRCSMEMGAEVRKHSKKRSVLSKRFTTKRSCEKDLRASWE